MIFQSNHRDLAPNHFFPQAFPVKSVSPGSNPPSLAFSHEQLASALLPHAQAFPLTDAFSVDARSQVHSPAGRAPMVCISFATPWVGLEKDLRQLHLAPEMLFSVAFFSQLQFMADCLPHEQVAFSAQMHSEARPQQVVGLTILRSMFLML